MPSLVAVAVAAAAVVPRCSWDEPGLHPYMGDVPAAVDRYTEIPVESRRRLKARMERREYDDTVLITRDAIVGRASYAPQLRSMHFGNGTMCREVSRAGWGAGHQERGLVYCDGPHCVVVPSVCRNVSLLDRIPPGGLPPVAGVGPPAEQLTLGPPPGVLGPPGVVGAPPEGVGLPPGLIGLPPGTTEPTPGTTEPVGPLGVPPTGSAVPPGYPPETPVTFEGGGPPPFGIFRPPFDWFPPHDTTGFPGSGVLGIASLSPAPPVIAVPEGDTWQLLLCGLGLFAARAGWQGWSRRQREGLDRGAVAAAQEPGRDVAAGRPPHRGS